MLRIPFGIFSRGVGIDLGTANSLVYVAGRGIVVNEPSVAAVNAKTSQVLAVGDEAKKMIGRIPPHISVIRPLIGGVISDFEMTQELLRHFTRRASGPRVSLGFGKAVIGVPSNLTEVERKSVEDAVLGAGIPRAYVIEEPLAAALGARLPIAEPAASMIIEIGARTTQIPIIYMGGAVVSHSLRVAVDKLHDAIIRFVRDEFKLLIGEPTAEELKIAIGAAVPLNQKLEMAVRGRDLATGLPKEVMVKETHVRAAIAKSLRAMVDAAKAVVESAPPELAGDILRRGVYLCGGGSLLRGIDELVGKSLSVAATIVDDPLTCVARGTGVAVENLKQYLPLLDSPLRPRDIKI